MTDRIEAVREFLRSGKSVCPYARFYADRTGIALFRDYSERNLKYPVIDLVNGSEMMSAIYVFKSDGKRHAKERRRAIELFKALSKTLAIEEYGESARAGFTTIERGLDIFFSPESYRNPLLTYMGKPYFTTAMNALYGTEHPRWSPVSMVVITRQSDVRAVPEEVRVSIEREIQRRMGKEYDADQLYISPA